MSAQSNRNHIDVNPEVMWRFLTNQKYRRCPRNDQENEKYIHLKYRPSRSYEQVDQYCRKFCSTKNYGCSPDNAYMNYSNMPSRISPEEATQQASDFNETFEICWETDTEECPDDCVCHNTESYDAEVSDHDSGAEEELFEDEDDKEEFFEEDVDEEEIVEESANEEEIYEEVVDEEEIYEEIVEEEQIPGEEETYDDPLDSPSFGQITLTEEELQQIFSRPDFAKNHKKIAKKLYKQKKQEIKNSFSLPSDRERSTSSNPNKSRSTISFDIRGELHLYE